VYAKYSASFCDWSRCLKKICRRGGQHRCMILSKAKLLRGQLKGLLQAVHSRSHRDHQQAVLHKDRNLSSFECHSTTKARYTVPVHTHTVLLPSCILSGTTQVSQHQKGKTRKVKPIWVHWSTRLWMTSLFGSVRGCDQRLRPNTNLNAQVGSTLVLVHTED